MFVLGVEEVHLDHSKRHDVMMQSIMTEADRIELENEMCYWKDFDNKKLTIIYMFNATDYEDTVDDLIQETIDHVKLDKDQQDGHD